MYVNINVSVDQCHRLSLSASNVLIVVTRNDTTTRFSCHL